MKNSSGTMLDLSFLTDEEYQKLLNVLQRDAELQKKDSDRIQRLQGSIRDEKKKKCVTGEWFHDVKSQRFCEDLQGSELLRASIRKKRVSTQSKEIVRKKESTEARAEPVIFNKLSLDQENERVRTATEETETSPTTFQSNFSELLAPRSPQKSSITEDMSPVRPMVGISTSFSSDASSPYEKTTGSLTNMLLYDENEPWSSTPKDSSLRSPPVPARRSIVDESSSASKRPVKKKESKETFWPEPLPHADHSDNVGRSRETFTHSSSSSPDTESSKETKISSNFTVQSMKDKQVDQENRLEKNQFMSLKSFWEKGGDVSPSKNSSSDQESPSTKQSLPERQSHNVSQHYNKKQNGEEKKIHEHPSKIKHFSPRAQVVSSSEDELFHVSPPRKAPSSMIPRSTYSRSKGSPILKNSSLSETNGTSLQNEENTSSNRSMKKSRLPVRIPSVSKETNVESVSSPKEHKLPEGSELQKVGFEEEFITPESNTQVKESLYSRVQILIDTVSSDDEQGTSAKMEAEQKSIDVVKNSPSETENGNNLEGNLEESQTCSMNSARSMVNIYKSTETYKKPQTLSHQLLEPERAKELSRSTPALLSETESDTASEISFQLKRHRKTQSSDSNSSDMASVSSVSNSVLSVYSGDFGSVDAQGAVQFSLDYDEKNREFQIFVTQCKDLATVDEKKGRSDPYVKTYLLPDKARMGKRKTSVKRKTTNPIYNEVLRYKIEKMVLLIQKLNLSVWHNDPLGRNSFLGEMEIDLTSWDWSNTAAHWYNLKPKSLSAMNGVDHLGVMNLSIKYIPPGSIGPKYPPSGEVHIWVKDTKDLPQLRPSGVDSFVKCYVLPDTSKKSYQKTRVIKKDSNPVFNHTIVYDGFHTEDLRDACVELTVWDHEKLSNHFLGGIRLGLGTGISYGIAVDWMDSTQEEVAFWQEMMSSPKEWIEGSLPLRSLAGKRKFK
ncbi:hypothetical protein GDO86_015213 [Hymenochirus boettgeri]|uniref:Synaptotagmin-like protein 2 n=1 Tax=Hymenochirus boettgeri TaxID=247094 RepID=A0A8T2JVR5_9PIPI|nr:hypothetical protein GDO86_015213 [Hymenochirus boettgeri]